MNCTSKIYLPLMPNTLLVIHHAAHQLDYASGMRSAALHMLSARQYAEVLTAPGLQDQLQQLQTQLADRDASQPPDSVFDQSLAANKSLTQHLHADYLQPQQAQRSAGQHSGTAGAHSSIPYAHGSTMDAGRMAPQLQSALTQSMQQGSSHHMAHMGMSHSRLANRHPALQPDESSPAAESSQPPAASDSVSAQADALRQRGDCTPAEGLPYSGGDSYPLMLSLSLLLVTPLSHPCHSTRARLASALFFCTIDTPLRCHSLPLQWV